MIRRILVKDLKLLWPMAVLMTAIQAARAWVGQGVSFFADPTASNALVPPLTVAWFVGLASLAAAVVQLDPVPGVDQDWLIRPIRRRDLVLAKLLFLALVVSVPMLLLDLATGWVAGIPFGAILGAAVARVLFVYACFLLPVAALAAMTRSLTELIALAAALVVVFAVSLSVSFVVRGGAWCPTCGSGMAWLEHFAQHAITVVGALLILGLQYGRRRTNLSRGLALAGAAALVLLQMPWSGAFALERWAMGSGRGAAVALVPESSEVPIRRESSGSRHDAAPVLGRDVGRALDYLHRRAGREAASISLDIPLRIQGVAPEERLLVDRSEARVAGADGHVLELPPVAGWRAGLSADSSGDPMSAGPATQTVELPAGAYRRLDGGGAQLIVTDTLTLVGPAAVLEIEAGDGAARTPDGGVCISRVQRDRVTVGCRAVGAAPFCYGASLYTADGPLGSPVLKCDADYRRHWPTLIDVLTPYGVELSAPESGGRADRAALEAARVRFTIYRELDHFERRIALALRASR